MKPAGRIAAAIEVLAEVADRHRPAAIALADWGRAHRFAGAGDRSAIGNLVYDALRRRLSAAARMGSDSPRALVLATLRDTWGLDVGAIAALCIGTDHAPEPLSAGEQRALEPTEPLHIADHERANVPGWLWPAFTEAFGAAASAEGEALARRAPLDLRCNTLKSTPEKVLRTLERFGAAPAGLVSTAIRIAPPDGGGRTPNVQAEAGFQRGHFEVQDQGSQAVAALVEALPGMQVLDLCAGGGGKTLALAAAMENKGQIFAYDSDRLRLQPIYERLQRAGARNVQVRAPGDGALDDLAGRMHRVVVDAPCTGSGVWRRRPDAKWRLTPEALAARLAEQSSILAEAARHVRPGGRLCYITCSVLGEENEGRIAAFLERHPTFTPLPLEGAWRAMAGAAPSAWPRPHDGLLLTPARTATDGFFITVLERRS
ncbi:MAG: MFS transporter [Rhizobiales bacterium]|nr:MFS transporter [Hyphomicrobiales bacterium]